MRDTEPITRRGPRIPVPPAAARRLRLQIGQASTQYALILVLVSVAAIVVLATMGHHLHNSYSNVATALHD